MLRSRNGPERGVAVEALRTVREKEMITGRGAASREIVLHELARDGDLDLAEDVGRTHDGLDGSGVAGLYGCSEWGD